MEPKARVAELDLLRFLAAVSVVAYHLLSIPEGVRPVVRFGWMGVPLFFMISGFVILWTATTKDAYGFVASRVARLYPSFWVGVLLTVVVIGGVSAGDLFANLTMLPTYFGSERIDGVYWTLEVEIMFYAIVFMLLVTKQLKRIEWILAGWLATCVFDVPWVTLGGWAPFFISGCYLFLIRSRPSYRLGGGLAVSAVLSVFAALEEQSGFTHTLALSVQMTTAALVLAFHAAFAALALKWFQLPASPVWYWLGSLTYPLYLVHNIIGKTIYAQLPFAPWVNIACVLVVVAAITVVMAVVIEQRLCPAVQRMLLRLSTSVASSRLARRLTVW